MGHLAPHGKEDQIEGLRLKGYPELIWALLWVGGVWAESMLGSMIVGEWFLKGCILSTPGWLQPYGRGMEATTL